MTTHTTAGPADETREGRVGPRAARADLRAGAADGTDGGGVGARSTGPTVRTGRGPTSPTGPPYPLAQTGPPSPRPTRGAADGTAGGGVGPSSTGPAPARNIGSTRQTRGAEEGGAALHERNPDRCQSHRQQTPTRRAANTRFPPKPPPANTDPPRGKQRPADLARSALVSRSLRARCALRAPRAARTGRLWRHVNRLADWGNGSRDYLIIFRFGCVAALHNQSSRWIKIPSAASLSIYRLRTGSYLDRIWL